MSTDDFVTRQNIERYRHLLKTTTDDAQRRTILKLLEEIEAKQQQGDNHKRG